LILDDFEVLNVPQTIHPKPKPRPSLPKIPLEIEDDEFSGDELTDFPDLDYLASLGDPPAMPQIKEPDIWDFEKVEQKPVLRKQALPHYPEMARKTGVEGTVVVKVLIDKKGNVEKTEIFKSVPVLDDAALIAAKKCKFKPAKQRDKLVKVWMYIPFKFKLK